MSNDEYSKAADAFRAAIRTAHDRANAREIALNKRAMERELRAAGHTGSQAAALVARIFKIHKLGDQ
jgi:hypothetical protein